MKNEIIKTKMDVKINIVDFVIKNRVNAIKKYK